MSQSVQSTRSSLQPRSRGRGVLAAVLSAVSSPRSLPLIAALLFCCAPVAGAQRSGDFGMTYTQERTNFLSPASTTAFQEFYLRGASIDLGYSLWKGLGVAGSGIGLAATNLDGTIDIHHVQFLAGPRYTYNLGHITPTAWNRKGGIFIEGKAGYTFATAGLYPINGVVENHASGLTYLGGGGINFHIYHRFDLRLIEADFVRTQLPNGSNNEQNTIRLASGINFHLGN